jgi:protein phosphatase
MNNGVCAILDGVGGHRGGSIAAEFVAAALCEVGNAGTDSSATLAEINRSLIDFSHTSEEYSGMGTCCTGMSFPSTENFSFFHIGNTRLYMLNQGYLRQVTRDHTTVQRMLDTRRLTYVEATIFPRRNEIYACFGGAGYYLDHLVSEAASPALQSASTLLLTSDGVHEYLPLEELEKLLIDEKIPDCEKPEKILAAALDSGSEDDISVIIVYK